MKRILTFLLAAVMLLGVVTFLDTGATKAEAVTVSRQEYEVYYTGRHSSFLCNRETVGNAVGTEYFLTYTVESVTSSGSQNGFLGTCAPESQFPYTEGNGLLYYQQRKSNKEAPMLLLEGYTYFIKFTVTESGYRYIAARAKGSASEYFVIEGKATDGEASGKNYGYFGLWFGDGLTEAHLTHVRFYDANGKDLGVWSPRSLANVAKCGADNPDTQLEHAYTVTANEQVNLAISNEQPLTTDKMYIEYTVAEAQSNANQSGISLSDYPKNTYPHSNGMLKYESVKQDQTSLLLEPGAQYLIVVEKGNYGFSAIVRITKDGQTTTKVYPLVSGSYEKDAGYFSLWFGTGQDCKTSFVLENVKIYDSERNNLGVQSNNSNVRIRHFGAVLDYESCEAVYYCQETGALYTLYADQTLRYEAGGEVLEGTYSVKNNQITVTIGEESQTYDYLYSGFTAQESQQFKRLYTYQVTFVAGNDTEDLVQTMNMENGYKATKPADPVLEGCSFEGWCTSDGEAYDFDAVVDQSVTLYAKWTNGAGITYLASQGPQTGGGVKIDFSMLIICLMIAVMTLIIIISILKKRKQYNRDARTLSWKNRNLIWFILFACAVPVINWFVFYVYPNASSVVMAFLDSEGNPSLVNFQRLWTEFQLPTSTIRIALKNTLITFCISLACFIPRVLVSYFIYKKVPGYKIYRILFFLPSILFSVCVAMCFTRMVGTTGFIAEFVQNVLGLERTPELLADSRFANYTIWLNMLWLGFPGDLIIWGGTFARLPEDVLESARLDGVNWITEFTKIVVPMVWPTVALKMVLTACGVLGATGQVYLLTKGDYGTMTLSAWLYRTLIESSGTKYTSNVFNYLSAVGIVMTVISVTIALIVRKYTDKAFQDVDY